MVYKNIQSLASGETKDIIIHIGPIFYIPMHIKQYLNVLYNPPCQTPLKSKHDEIISQFNILRPNAHVFPLSSTAK